MEPINPYAVMRNTAAHDAYKAYRRKAALAGQPYTTLAILMLALSPAGSMVARTFLHRPARDWWVAIACYVLPAILAAVFVAIGGARMLHFRKANPIPDEWQQVPRAGSMRATRTPQTPA